MTRVRMGLVPLCLAGCGTGEPLDRVDPELPTGDVRFTVDLNGPASWVVRLDREAAPATVENLLRYVDAGFYDGSDGAGATIMHRVMPGFVVQGGGVTAEMKAKPVLAPVTYEGDNGRSNLRGTLAMARTDSPDSATSQWFVNLVDNLSLDHTPAEPGYTVFGEVVEGMEVIDLLADVPTTSRSGLEDVPVDPVLISEVLRGP